MFGAGAFAWSGVVVVCVAFGFICFVLFLFLFFSFFFFSLGIKGGLKLFLAVVQWVGSFGGLSRRLCPYNLTPLPQSSSVFLLILGPEFFEVLIDSIIKLLAENISLR